MEELKDKKIAIIGLGGLGGYVANCVARLNPNTLILIDGDIFSRSNLNRQLFCTQKTIGKNKALCAKEFLSSATKANIITEENFLSENNIDILKNVDIVMDATDNIKTRFLVKDYCKVNNIPIVHGAINGFYGQVAIIRPNSNMLDKIYPTKKEREIRETHSFVPTIIAGFEVSEMTKFFTNDHPLKDNELYVIDLLNNDNRILNI